MEYCEWHAVSRIEIARAQHGVARALPGGTATTLLEKTRLPMPVFESLVSPWAGGLRCGEAAGGTVGSHARCAGRGSTSRSGRSRCPRRRRSSVLVKTHEKGRLRPPRPASSCARRCTTSGRGSTGRGRPSRRLPSVSRKHAAPESSSRSRSAGLCPSKPFVRQRGTPRRDGRARSVPCRRVGRGRSARRCVAKGIRPHRQGRSRSKCARAHGVDQRRNGRPPRRRPLAPRARPAGRRRRGRLLALVPERSEPPPSPNDMASRMERTFTATGACA